MLKKIFLFVLLPHVCFGQLSQIGNDIDGENHYDGSGWSISLNGDGNKLAIGAFGNEFSIEMNNSGNIIAIGAWFNDGNGNDSGHVRVYRNINNSWLQVGEDINGENAGDRAGKDVSIND